MKRIQISRGALTGAQRNRCFYCGVFMSHGKTPETRKKDTLRTRDHIVPLSSYSGSPKKENNVILSCFRCNCRRGTNQLSFTQLRRIRYVHLAAIAAQLAGIQTRG